MLYAGEAIYDMMAQYGIGGIQSTMTSFLKHLNYSDDICNHIIHDEMATISFAPAQNSQFMVLFINEYFTIACKKVLTGQSGIKSTLPDSSQNFKRVSCKGKAGLSK